jgi:hypothetical protein
MYQILRNGKAMKGSSGTLRHVVNMIRLMEMDIDRLTQHSPFTIGKV